MTHLALQPSFGIALYGASYDPETGAGAIPFPHTKKIRHSSRWDHGNWTDDTDQLLLIMETILESFASRNSLQIPRTHCRSRSGGCDQPARMKLQKCLLDVLSWQTKREDTK